MKVGIVLFILMLVGCTQDRQFSPDASTDLNGDGVLDVFYERDGKYDYDLYDSNFDGEVDQSYKYLNEVLISSTSDQNFDGLPDARMFYRYGVPCLSWVDIDVDGLPEIYNFYENGVIERSEYYCANCEGYNLEKSLYKYSYRFNPPERLIIEMSKKEYYYRVLENKSCISDDDY